MKSEYIDSLEKGMVTFLSCLLFWLHAVCVHCSLDSIPLDFLKVTKDLLPVILYMYLSYI